MYLIDKGFQYICDYIEKKNNEQKQKQKLRIILCI